MKILEKYWIFIFFIISFFSIGLALIAELIFNILPCKMCLNQRYAYYFIIFITLVFFLTNFFSFFLKLLIFEIAIFYGLFYSIWHVGIEQKILPGPENCESSLSKSDSISKLLRLGYYNFDKVSASVWLRCLQLIPYLEEKGIRCRINDFSSESDISIFVRWQDDQAYQ